MNMVTPKMEPDTDRTILKVFFYQVLNPAYNPEKELRLIKVGDGKANAWIHDLETGGAAFLGAVDHGNRVRDICRLLSTVEMDETLAGPAFDSLSDGYHGIGGPTINYKFVGCARMEAELILLCWSWFEEGELTGAEVLALSERTLATLFRRHDSLLDESCLRVLCRCVNRRRAGRGLRL